MNIIKYKPIGIVHSPFKTNNGIPVKPLQERETEGTVEIFSEYTEGLADLDGYSHIILLCHFHLSSDYALKVVPFVDKAQKLRGLFSTRSPNRPNSIGLSTVRLVKIENNILTVKGIDIVDGTPVLDIKPYVTKIDWIEKPTLGWMEEV
ncbi:MAG: tRNA (N6-threonylcarbamoyladenosine(37)-N6)-methyltransferase TrmO [Spirochaetota bacterium]|nr:tRNA (N6-threonylcarbamoyladenosine(37)-N6)-methyltransferase TrmO [Spirochaetota bacterium]